MLVFATEFPVAHSHSMNRFQEAVVKWITGSPHTKIRNEDFVDIHDSGEWELSLGDERIQSLAHRSPMTESAAIRYVKQSDSMRWSTTITFLRGSESWIGINLICDSESPTPKIPAYKKPLIVRTLLREMGGATDGEFLVQDSPVFLSNNDIDRAVRFVNGNSLAQLPIVYVSSRFQGGYALNPQSLALELSGMAHILVEPNRAFSHRLKIEVDARNAYGGAIGIYWPNGDGRRSVFRTEEYASAQELEERVTTEIRTALINRRPTSSCTWAYLQNEISHQTYLSLKESKSQAIDEFTKEFDRELSAKAILLQDAEKEILRLKSEIKKHESRALKSSQKILYCGEEQDFYENEILEIVRDALMQGVSAVRQDSRRFHILSEIVNSLPECSEASARREKLKNVLRGYRSMNLKVRSSLEDLGFSVTEEGKHFKLIYQGDDRYTFSLPKSGSDHRGGLNSVSDMATLFF